MPLITWSPDLETGIPEVDYQHRNLVSMLNALHAAIEDGASPEILGEILEELDAYVITHFSSEERLMERLDFEHMDEHRVEHHRLAEAVQRYRHAFAAGKCEAGELREFLIRWLFNHIAGADRLIGEAWRKQQQPIQS